MRTSAILRRVADFLKEYPPFCYLAEDVLESVAGKGRVRFREKDDLIFEEGRNRERFFYVIQSGAVKFSCRRGEEDILVDMRGPGELFGLGGLPGGPVYGLTARAMEDTILYALEAETFREACAENPRAMRFLSILVASTPEEPDPGSGRSRTNWFKEMSPVSASENPRLLLCPPDASAREVAGRMAAVDDGAMVVVDKLGRPVGLCARTDILARVAAGGWDGEEPVSQMMRSPVLTTPPTASVGENLLLMMRYGIGHLCVTEGGGSDSPAVGIVSERDLMLSYGNNPLVLLKAIRSAPRTEALAGLRGRMEALVGRGLRSGAEVDWFCEVVSETDRALVARLAELLGQGEGADWLLLGAAGRREHLVQAGLGIAAIALPGEDPVRAAARHRAMEGALRACGYTVAPPAEPLEGFAATREEWESAFREWISRPLESGIHARLAFFDFDPVGLSAAADGVRAAVKESLRASPAFLSLLANDCLAHLPPLTIFEGMAVDESGKVLGRPDIKAHALRAVTDAARTLALEVGDLESRSTPRRLENAATRIPEARELLLDSARAARVALFLRARGRFSLGREEPGEREPAEALSRTEQALLKHSFRTIAALLGFVVKRHGLA